MKGWIRYVFAAIAFSGYVFPIELEILPGINSKMAIAVLGVIILFFDVWSDSLKFPRFIVSLTVFAFLVSLAGFTSILFNHTNDTSYSRYWISYLVWLSAAYAIGRIIAKVHREVNVKTICNYMIAVCVTQCVCALLIEFIPICKIAVDSVISQNQETLTAGGRLYGIGASLDTAGSRFTIALIMIAYLLSDRSELNKKEVNSYMFAYAVIAIVGNMIGRTTLVGVFLSLALFILMNRGIVEQINIRKILSASAVIVLSTILLIYLYDTNDAVRELIRFGFEPFFSRAETGEFASASSKQLKNMYIFPETFKTWIIGDGYFNNPNYYDPYYVGNTSVMGYYMGTDVGYLRLIFYFGLVGLVIFTLFLIKATTIACSYFPQSSLLFVFILIANMVIWLKVSTDLFFMMALFVCAAAISERDRQHLRFSNHEDSILH